MAHERQLSKRVAPGARNLSNVFSLQTVNQPFTLRPFYTRLGSFMNFRLPDLLRQTVNLKA